MTKRELIESLTNDFTDLSDDIEINVLLICGNGIVPVSIKNISANECGIFLNLKEITDEETGNNR